MSEIREGISWGFLPCQEKLPASLKRAAERLANPLFEILARETDVILRGFVQSFNVVGGQRPDDFRWIAKDQGSWGDFTAGRDHGSSTNEALFTNFRAIKDNRAHTNEGKRMNRARMRDHIVGNRHTIAENRGDAATEDVNCRVILDIDALAHANVADIAPDNRVKPDTRFFSNMHISDDVSTLLNVRARADLWREAVM